MKPIQDETLKQITGGGISVFGVAVIVGLVVFVTGIIDGVVHPKKCTE